MYLSKIRPSGKSGEEGNYNYAGIDRIELFSSFLSLIPRSAADKPIVLGLAGRRPVTNLFAEKFIHHPASDTPKHRQK